MSSKAAGDQSAAKTAHPSRPALAHRPNRVSVCLRGPTAQARSVPDNKVIDRYHKSIALLTEACEVAHRAYIFDNSGSKHKLLAEVTDFDTIRFAASVIKPWFVEIALLNGFS